MDTTAFDTTAPAAATMPMEGRSYQTDAEILTFLNTANAYEIEGAELASTRATTEQVREFAQTLQNDHETLRTRIAEVQEPGATAGATELGETDELVSYHRDAMEELAEQEDADFDRQWLEHQVEMHERALAGIQDALNANPSEELRNVLTEAQTEMQAHLEQAQQLRDQVENTGTN